MLKKRLFSLFLLTAFIIAGTAIYAQADKKGQDKKGVELLEPVQPQKPKGAEKVLIYNGEYLKVQLYGFVRLDMVYNTANVRHESGPLFVENQVTYFDPSVYQRTIAIRPTLPHLAGGLLMLGGLSNAATSSQKLIPIAKTSAQKDGSFVMDARTTRIGLKVNGPKVLLADTMAQVECDFWGTMAKSGTANRQGMIRMRHAIARLDWPSGTFLVVGQYWSVAMAWPAQPSTLTFIPFGESGNLFMREPMVWLGQKVGNEKFNATLEVAAARVQAGADSGVATDLYPGTNNSQLDDAGPGEASKLPGGRARLTFVINPVEIFSLTLGGSGHYQLEKHAITYAPLLNPTLWPGWVASRSLGAIPGTTAQQAAVVAFIGQKQSRTTRSYSAQGFGKITISLVSILGAYWRGTNMDTFLSGLGTNGAVENYSSTKILALPEQGGYGQLILDLRKVGPIPIQLVGGFGGIKKNNSRYVYTGTILWNSTIMGNITWFLNDYMHVGFEVAKHRTKWKGAPQLAEDMRYHTQVQFTF